MARISSAVGVRFISGERQCGGEGARVRASVMSLPASGGEPKDCYPWTSQERWSGEGFFDEFAGVYRGAFVAAVVGVGEAEVVESEEVEDRGVEVVDVVGGVDG